MKMLAGKRALITGVASQRSIAWGLAKSMAQHGAEICLSYQNEKLKDRVEKLGEECQCSLALPCDVSSDEQIEQLFEHRPCLLYTSPSPRDRQKSRMPSSA